MSYTYDRRHVAADLRESPEFRRRLEEGLRKEMERIVRGDGKVVHIEAYEPAKGGGCVVVFDTECAALKARYKYEGTPNLSFGKSPTYGGWYISTRD